MQVFLTSTLHKTIGDQAHCDLETTFKASISVVLGKTDGGDRRQSTKSHQP